MDTVRVAELFTSLQGESHWAGYPCAFVRLAGCNLDCSYCDTPYAKVGGEERAVAAVADEVLATGAAMAEVTGGEPLTQPGTLPLLRALRGAGLRVLLETNGSLPVDGVPPGIRIILDLKTPGSGMADRNRWENLARLKPEDEVKFVLCDRVDYEWARSVVKEYRLRARCRVDFSPVVGRLDPAALAEWIVEDRLDVRLQLQLHKILWPNRDRGV
jgi:7-carboxy-7-deazaguanine synthase